MAKPNKTVGEWNRKNPRVVTEAEREERYARARARSPELFDVMDKVQTGEWTVKQAVEWINNQQAAN